MDESIQEQLWAVVRCEGLHDPSWVLALQDDDEPPLFTRDSQLEFLRSIPANERGPSVLNVSLLLMQRIAEYVAGEELCSEQRIFCCVTFTDFDAWRECEQVVPTPSLYVHPHEERAPAARHRFITVESQEGREVARWLNQLDPRLAEQFCVAELEPGEIDPELRRIYVGWIVNPSTQLGSVGNELLTTKHL